ncbi:MAG: sodium-independent anion transporter [Bacteroidetes bacterium HGW-Bacteroidetes-15]|nr:MAG: sodium-independent anion transporter [Bacteroidetes bacterium HGW-Bacteroidetes-15]
MNSIFKPKLFSILKEGYTRHSLQKDVMAGIIVGIVALPLAIAFAIASGVSPEKGLITAIVAGFLISFLGGSRVQIGGPTGAFVVIVFGIVEQYGIEGLIISTFLAGLMLMAFGLLRLGTIIKFIPHPLIVGFTSGIAIIIFSTQIKQFFGLSIDQIPSEFIPKWGTYLKNLNSINLFAVAISVGTVLITVYSKRVLKKIPGSFIAIILMTLASMIFKLPVSTIGSVYGELPSSISLSIPSIDFGNFSQYIAPAFTIALLGAIESLLSAVVADGMISGNHRSNTELIAQGIANMASAIFGGIPATGAIARTATNVKNGGRTPVAGIVHAITLLLIVMFFGKWAVQIPLACLAGILVVVAYNMSEWRSFYSILRGSRYDILVLLSTFFLTVLVDLTVAIQIGMVLASLLFMQRMANASHVIAADADMDALEDYSDLPKGVEVYEIKGPFFFAAAQKYRETLKNFGKTGNVLILRMRFVPFIDSTGIHNFRETVKYLKAIDVKLILSGVQPEVKKELRKARIDFLIGRNNVCDNYNEAKEKAIKAISE